MSQREEFLREQGYEEPFDESPVEVPAGWHGGDVRNTGGNIMCRIWRNFDGTEKQDDEALEVIYNVSQDERVALQRYTWDGDYYTFDEIIESRDADGGDAEQAEVARELMDVARQR